MNDADPPSIRPVALYERLAARDPVSVLDLRDLDEVKRWAIDGPSVDRVQAPPVRFLQAKVRGEVPDVAAEVGLDGPVIVVCAEGKASATVASILQEAEIDASNLAGGMDAWADLLVANDLPGSATITQYLRPATGCVSYLVASEESAAVIDPLRAEVDRYREDARDQGVSIEYAIDTHVHADHLSGARDLADRTDATPVLPAGARDRGLAFEARLLEDGDTLDAGETRVEAIHAPGHTTEMTALRVEAVLLTGDSLFLSSVARPDLQRGEEAADLAGTLHETLHERLLELPGETVVAPGHVGPAEAPDESGAYAADLGDLRERLDVLGLDCGAFVERVLADLPPRPANHETIVNANLGRTTVDPAEAFELELGPNNCAVSG